jgi:hypothetical protein
VKIFIKKAKLEAKKSSTYTMYVFKIYDTEEYIMCTRLPNWQTPEILIGDEGFLQYQIVYAGEEFYDPILEKKLTYKYNNIYFINFILSPILENNKNNNIIL